ncbi:MAG TPA: ABC transporter permease subunit [Vicinamibacterales bacterium]|nr:ABC transporter permease subunit [Vicinamibacterales bacterium]
MTRAGNRLGGLTASQAAGGLLVTILILCSVGATFLSPNDPIEQFADRAYAPPMRIRIWDGETLRWPFVYPQLLENRLERRFSEDTTRPVPITWLSDGRLMSIDRSGGPLLVLGGDALGRDLLARVLRGAQVSLGVTAVGLVGALLVGLLIGGVAGTYGGRADTVLMALADFVLILPAAYLVLVLRGVLPLTLSTAEVFMLMATIFAVAAWPHVARGVRAILAVERRRDYAEAAIAAGAGPFRLLRQLLPAARGFIGVEVLLLVPALLVAETTVSYLGLGFAEPRASWGTLLQEAGNVRVMAEAPWMLAPAAAIFLVVLGVQLLGRGRAQQTVLSLGARAA